MNQKKNFSLSTDIKIAKYFVKKIYPPVILVLMQLLIWVLILGDMVLIMRYDDPQNLLEAGIFIQKTLYLLLLPVVEIIYCIAVKIRRRRRRLKPRTLLPKTENRNLMGFYPVSAFKATPTILYTLPGIFLFFLERKYMIAFLLVLWLLLQLLERKLILRDKESEKKKRLRKDVLSIHQQEKTWSAKSLNYAIIMEDDSGLIPSAFGNGNYPVTKVLLFDQATEIAPFLAEDSEKNFSENWESLYLHSHFFIYAFDSAKYTMEELEQKCIRAVTSFRFPVSKPLYLFILGLPASLEPLVLKYAWIPEVSIRILTSWDQLTIQDIVDDYIEQKRIPWYKDMDEDEVYAESLGSVAEKIYSQALVEYSPIPTSLFYTLYVYGGDDLKYSYLNYITYCGRYLSLPLEEVDCRDRDYFYHYLNSLTTQIFCRIQNWQLHFYTHAHNLYVCGFFSNIFRWKEMSIAVMSEFEYAHLALRFAHYYLFSKHRPGPIKEYFKEDKELGPAILELAQPDDMLYSSLHRKMDLSDPLLHNALLILKDLFGIEHREKDLDFLHLTNLLRLSRNITRGHGAIRSGMQDQIWFALYVLLSLLNEMLFIGSMEIELDGEHVNVSYKEDKRWYWDPHYAIVREQVPVLLHRISNKNRLEYINYYKGNAAVPEVMSLFADNLN